MKILRYVAYAAVLALALYAYQMSGTQREPGPEGRTAQEAVPDPLTPSASLNVRRERFTEIYESAPFDLSFDFVPLADGRSRVIGRSTDGATVMELIGPPEAVSVAVLTAALPSDNALVKLKNMTAVATLVDIALSDWPTAGDWVSNNIDNAFQQGRVTTTANGKQISMSTAPRTESLVITVSGEPL